MRKGMAGEKQGAGKWLILAGALASMGVLLAWLVRRERQRGQLDLEGGDWPEEAPPDVDSEKGR